MRRESARDAPAEKRSPTFCPTSCGADEAGAHRPGERVDDVGRRDAHLLLDVDLIVAGREREKYSTLGGKPPVESVK
jgi:hypothetical protein